MVLFPNAKINLGLYITERRTDGFHSIETIFLPVPSLCDILEVLPTEGKPSGVTFTSTGITIDTNPTNNLCVKAYNVLGGSTSLPSVTMHLHKQIPFGAGMGGGSADGAFALKMLNELATPPLPLEQLSEIALELGSDCPYFLINTPCFASGRGEVLSPIDLNLAGYHLLIVNPGIIVPTGKAFGESTPRPAPVDLRQAIKTPVSQWKGTITNDFESIVFGIYPEIASIKEKLYALGATYAAMSGSGSTLFGLFSSKPKLDKEFEGMFVHTAEIGI